MSLRPSHLHRAELVRSLSWALHGDRLLLVSARELSLQLIGVSLSTVTGSIRTELMLNPAGTYLEIRDARVVGVDQDGNTLTVDLSGNINCTSNALEDGTLSNGVLHNVASSTDTLFTGEAQAMYSEDPHSDVGTFTVTAEGLVPLLTGRGTWSSIIND